MPERQNVILNWTVDGRYLPHSWLDKKGIVVNHTCFSVIKGSIKKSTAVSWFLVFDSNFQSLFVAAGTTNEPSSTTEVFYWAKIGWGVYYI